MAKKEKANEPFSIHEVYKEKDEKICKLKFSISPDILQRILVVVEEDSLDSLYYNIHPPLHNFTDAMALILQSGDNIALYSEKLQTLIKNFADQLETDLERSPGPLMQ